MKIKNYIIQGLFPLFAAGMFIAPLLSSCEEDDAPTNTAPTLAVQEVANALRTSATLTGSISGETSLLKEYGFDYSTSQDFPSDRTTRVPMTESGTPSSLSVQVKDLTPNERYYYRLYASTGASTVYSDTQDFRTANMSAPQISDLTVDSIGEQYARFIFQVEDYGNEVLIECGVSYKKSDSKTFIPIASEEITTDDRYVIEITDLEADTQYDFRPYAKNAQDKDATTGSIEGYGNILTQKTEAMLSASVETGAIDEGDISITSVKVAGTILSAVGSNGAIDECGFVYSRTNPLPTYNSDSRLVHQEEDINVSRDEYTYTEEITDLLQNTLYYVRAYAKSTVDGKERISYGTAYEFTTKQLNTPVLEFIYKGDNSLDYTRTATSLTVKATITNYDANALVEKGVIWSRSIGELSLEEAKAAGTYQAITTGENAIVATIKDLEMDCTYYIRAYAVYKSGDLTEIGYAQSVVLRTDGFNLPSLEAEANTQKLTYNSIELIGKIPNPGNADITERGFVLSSKISEVTLENCEKSVKAEKDFIVTMTGLKYQTEYYVRAYAKCTLGGRTETAYSGWISFRSQDCPGVEFSYGECSATATTLNIKATISNYNANTLVEKGVIWSKTQSDLSLADAKKANTYKAVTGGESQIAATIEGLELGNSYYVRAYIVYKSGDATETGYSDYTQLRTDGLNLPSLEAEANTQKLTYNSIELIGKISDSGNANITERGFVLSSKNSEVTLENCEKSVKAEKDFIATVTGLKYQTEYYVRAYAKCTLGGRTETAYSGWISFRSQDCPGVEFSYGECSATATTLNIKATISNYNANTLVEKGVIWSKTQSDLSLADAKKANTYKAVTGGESQIAATIEGLELGNSYYVRAYIVYKSGDATETGYSDYTQLRTDGLNLPSLEAEANTQKLTYNSIELIGKISDSGNANITERGFVLSSKNSEVTLENCEKSVKAEKDFIATVTGLKYQTEYYVRAYAKCTLGGRTETAYSSWIRFRSQDCPGVEFSYGECSATATTLNIKATISNYNANTLVEKGVIWSKTQSDLSLADAKKANTYKAVTGGESQIAATIEGLELGNSYYVRAYIVYKSGDATETGYSGYNQFRTDGFNLPNLGVDVTNEKMTYNSAELVGKIENSGNGKITERGFVLSQKLSEVTLENCDKAIKADESFVATATGLAYQTNYYVRAYVKCELGGKAETVYSGWNSFQTRDIDRPKFEAFESSTTLSSLNLTVMIEPGKQGTIVKRGFCAVLNENNAPEPTINDALKTEEAVTAASGKIYKAELKGLLFGTGYKVRAYAVVQLEDGEQLVCYSGTLWTSTENLSINMQFTPTDTQCTVQATIESDVDLSNAEYGFAWTEEDIWEPEKTTDRLKCTNMDAKRKFSGVIKNLTGGKQYHLWVYITINGRTIYSGGWNFTTKRAPGQDDNVSPDQKQ